MCCGAYFHPLTSNANLSTAGPLSSVWKEWIKWCIEFGIEANAIIAVPYDWRLSPTMLEERDLYFHKLKYVYGSIIHAFIIIDLSAVAFLLSCHLLINLSLMLRNSIIAILGYFFTIL